MVIDWTERSAQLNNFFDTKEQELIAKPYPLKERINEDRKLNIVIYHDD